MKISGPDALALLSKWDSESTEIKGLLEAFPQGSATLAFRGSLEVSEPDSLVVVVGPNSFELGLNLASVEFEYKDSREAPAELRDSTASNWAGLLVIRSKFWRCSFFEPK